MEVFFSFYRRSPYSFLLCSVQELESDAAQLFTGTVGIALDMFSGKHGRRKPAKFSLCLDGVEWFSARGQLMDASYVPVAGDIIFFDWEQDGSVEHVGIVEDVINGVVYTIEGYSENTVKRRSYSIGDSRIYGYSVLVY